MSEASFLQLARQAYDVLAVEHTDPRRWDQTLASLPLDRALLGVFAEWVRATGDAPVADVGCGSGRITRILADFGLDVFGVDLSPQMVRLAQIGDEIRRHDEVDGVKIPPWIAYRQQPDEVVELLTGAEFDMLARVVREPERGREPDPQGYLLARRAA